MPKPIAVLTHSISKALDWLQVDLHYKLREIDIPHRRVVREDGQAYYIINKPEQLLDLEISAIETIPGAARNPNYSEMYDLARSRMR